MKVGNQKLYLDVTSKVNGLVENAIRVTKNQLLDKVLLIQILTDATDTPGVTFMSIKPAESLGLIVLYQFGHMFNLYLSKWKEHVKPHSVWDFKHNLDPFKKANENNNISPLFWYNDYRGKQYKLFHNHKPGLLRFDDPWDMKTIEWAYDTFGAPQTSDSSERLLPFQAFIIYCSFFKIKTKN